MSALLKKLVFISLFLGSAALAADLPDAGRLLKENTPPAAINPRETLPPLEKKSYVGRAGTGWKQGNGVRFYFYR